MHKRLMTFAMILALSSVSSVSFSMEASSLQGERSVFASHSVQPQPLSEPEMEKTEGAWILHHALCGAIGASYYMSTTSRSDWSFKGMAYHTALGALGSYGLGVAGARLHGVYKSARGIGLSIGRPGLRNPNLWYKNANQYGRLDIYANKTPEIHFRSAADRFGQGGGYTQGRPLSEFFNK